MLDAEIHLEIFYFVKNGIGPKDGLSEKKATLTGWDKDFDEKWLPSNSTNRFFRPKTTPMEN